MCILIWIGRLSASSSKTARVQLDTIWTNNLILLYCARKASEASDVSTADGSTRSMPGPLTTSSLCIKVRKPGRLARFSNSLAGTNDPKFSVLGVGASMICLFILAFSRRLKSRDFDSVDSIIEPVSDLGVEIVESDTSEYSKSKSVELCKRSSIRFLAIVR
jgi:hypothetical protein